MEKIALSSLDIQPRDRILRNPADRAEVRRKESGRAEEVRRIVFSPDFSGMQYKKDGRDVILTRSIREGVAFQLSYFDRDGIPAMHENFVKTAEKAVGKAIHSEEELVSHYVRASLRRDVELETLRG